MALEYIHFDNGTFEGVYNESIKDGIVVGNVVATLQDSNEEAFAGSKSGKLTADPDFTNLAQIFPGRIFFQLWAVQLGRPYPVEINDNDLYTVKTRVFIPSGNPIGQNNLIIAIGDMDRISYGELVNANATTETYEELDPADTNYRTRSIVARAAAQDQWIEIEYRGKIIKEQFGQNQYFPINLLGYKYNNIGSNVNADIIDGGVMYIDNISIDPYVPIIEDCGLTIPDPEITVTHDTIPENLVGNGKIVINVTKPGSTLEYAISSVLAPKSNWQPSNVFQDLNGNYSYAVYVLVDGNCEYLIDGIMIYQELAPVQPTQQTQIIDLPNRHERNVVCDFKEYKPVWKPGERYANMVNSDELISDITDVFNVLKFSILNQRGVLVADDIATFTLYDDDGNGNARIAWEIDQFPSLPQGIYRAVIYEELQNKLYLVSNEHEVISNKRRLETETAYFEFSHSVSIYRFGYSELPDFVIKTRLHINAVDYSYPFDVEEYEEVTTGLSKNPRFDIDAAVEIETELYDEKAHRAFVIFLAHNNKIINNKQYIVQGGARYQQDRDKNSAIWNGSIVMKRQEFSTINKQ